jgi:hypothetical protein
MPRLDDPEELCEAVGFWLCTLATNAIKAKGGNRQINITNLVFNGSDE